MSALTITEINNLRNKVLEAMLKRCDKQLFDAFFKNTKVASVEGDTWSIVCESLLTKTFLEEQYSASIQNILENLTSTVYKIRFITQDDEITPPKVNLEIETSDFFKRSFINPNYTFESFVVGPFNNEAQKASIIVAANPGTLYQTLFIYGGSGLGKTHLLNSIGNYIKNTIPNLKILICSSQDFIAEYLDFVSTDSRKELLTKYIRKFDVFLIDDIQMLKDKHKTQEFFFNVYEEFRQRGKQVVITSDKLPSDLTGIDTRLITRFTSGLSVPITDPDVNTCIEILKLKVSTSGLDEKTYDENVFLTLATAFKDSIRSLEGALIRLNFYATLNRISHITNDVVAEALAGMFDSKAAQTQITETKIINTVAAYYGVSASQITGKMKTANLALARHISIYLIRTLLNAPYKKIGETFSNRDHSTIMHSVEKIQNLVEKNQQVKNVVDDLKRSLESK